MRIHHLNCGTMCPFGGSLFDGDSGLLRPGHLVCHCLMLEADDGLTLVDTGLGLRDVQNPQSRISPFFQNLLRPRLREEETAARQLELLGFSVEEVRHIILTHLDFDHAGGIEDFPNAIVHVLNWEYNAARHPKGFISERRYRPQQWDEAVHWRIHEVGKEHWFDFQSVQVIGSLSEPVLLIPLVGHTFGHCGVAVAQDGQWLLHAGDAYFYRDEMDLKNPRCVRGLSLYQRMMEVDRGMRLYNQDRLRDLLRTNGDNVKVISAHDHEEYEKARRTSSALLAHSA